MFTSNTCGACHQQIELLSKHFKKNKNVKIMIVDVDKYNVDFIEYTPTWYIPNNKGSFSVYNGVIKNKRDFNKLVRFSSTRFGPEIDSLAKNGKNFPGGGGFNVNKTFMNETEDKWGKGNDALISGSLGRDQKPGKFNNVLSNNYVNNIRMARPNDDLGSALYLNRTCNATGENKYPGMVYDSKNSQIVSNTNFGRKKNSFGYNYWGKAYSKDYLMEADTVKKMNGGGIQNENIRPGSVSNKDIYIGKSPEYKPLSFGKKNKMCTSSSVKTCTLKKK